MLCENFAAPLCPQWTDRENDGERLRTRRKELYGTIITEPVLERPPVDNANNGFFSSTSINSPTPQFPKFYEEKSMPI